MTNKGIRIPKSLIQIFISMPKNNTVNYEGLRYKLPRRINAEKVELSSNDNFIIQLYDSTITTKDYFPNSFDSF
jgi:hypothetical protein